MRASKIQIEGGRHARGIVVGGQQLRSGLFQIRRQQQASRRAQIAANLAQELRLRAGRNCRWCCPEKAPADARRRCGVRPRRAALPDKALEADDADAIDLAQFLAARASAVREISMG